MGVVGSLFDDEFEDNEVETEIEQVEDDASDTEIEEEASDDIEPEIETEDEAEAVVPEPVETTEEKPRQMAPVGAIKAERQKRQEAERKAAEYQAELDKLRQANRQPDQYNDDPYFNEFRERMRAEMFEERLMDSDERAREKHGAEAVADAAEWAKAKMANDPTLRESFLTSRRPIEMLVEQYQKETKISEMLTDEEAYIRRRAAELGLFNANADHGAASFDDEVEPAAMVNKPQAKPLPRRSLAGGQSQGRATDVPSGRLSAVGSLFS